MWKPCRVAFIASAKIRYRNAGLARSSFRILISVRSVISRASAVLLYDPYFVLKISISFSMSSILTPIFFPVNKKIMKKCLDIQFSLW